MPPLLLELWREQHPEAHEQVQLDFTSKLASRTGLSTEENTMEEVAAKLAELVSREVSA